MSQLGTGWGRVRCRHPAASLLLLLVPVPWLRQLDARGRGLRGGCGSQRKGQRSPRPWRAPEGLVPVPQPALCRPEPRKLLPRLLCAGSSVGLDLGLIC